MTQAQALVAALNQLLAGNTQKASGKKGKKAKKKGGRDKLTDAEKADFIAKNDAECVAAFTKAGYKDVQPRVNVMTYKKHIAAGRMVRKGEKAIYVGPFALFHSLQCDVLPVDGQTQAPPVQPNTEAPVTVQ